MEKINNFEMVLLNHKDEYLLNDSTNEKYKNFDWEMYVVLNKELKFLKTKEEAWYHWINNGEKEKRLFCGINELDNKKILVALLYESFDWKYYVEYYNEISVENIPDKISAWSYWFEKGRKKNHCFFKIPRKEKILYEKFDWVTYITLNEDLNYMDRNKAWAHWISYGQEENRPFSRINNTCIHRARFGNLFFINMAFHFMAIKNNLKISYKYYKQFKELGIQFFIGDKTYEEDKYVSDTDFLTIIQCKDKLEKNIVIDIKNFFCQTKEFCFFIRESFSKIFKESVIKKNIFNNRYNNNNDVFLHVRLGDVTNEKYKVGTLFYYDNILSKLVFDKGYISSDSIDHDICKILIKRYNLQIVDFCEISTIMFATTCKYLLLSGGTFSWLIGFLAFYSDAIYYPKRKNTWYDDIFVFDEWIPIVVLE